MGEGTKISWTDNTFNAWIGCEKVSAGCANCYAEAFAKRVGRNVWGKDADREVTKSPWENVRRWNRAALPSRHGFDRQLVFLGSMMDWAEDRPDLYEPRQAMWTVVRECTNLIFQMLTKRPENIRKFLPNDWGSGYENVWLGTSVEDMRVASRGDHLRTIPAVVRFISYEPALGPLDEFDLTGIDWVLYGGESGNRVRHEDKDWARSMLRKCRDAGIAFHHKQSVGRYSGMNPELDGKIYFEFPTPRAAV